MRKKFVSIVVCMLLFATVLTVTAAKQSTMATPSMTTAGQSNSINPVQVITLRDKTAYAYQVNGVTGSIQFDLSNPGGATQIKASSTNPFAASWINGQWYIISYQTNNLYTVDPATGTETLVGSTGVASNQVVLGMAYSDVTQTAYATFTVATSSTDFYTVDLTTGHATKIGTWSGDALIDLACDANGLFYGPGLTSDKLYAVDPTVPSATAIGSLGLSINYAQGAAFDKDAGILYLAAYTTGGGLYTCDTTTGQCTLVGMFPSSPEVDALAIPYAANSPPETPAAPTGPDTGFKNVSYTFSASTTDPDGDQISYMFDWGDGTNSSWIGPINSGDTASTTHTYTAIGTFAITVVAVDINGHESGVSDPHMISISQGAPILKIQALTGGLFKIKTSIKNTGSLPASSVAWSIVLTGGAFIGKNTTGTITTIGAGSSEPISSKMIIGFGKTVVAVKATCIGSSDAVQQNGTILLIFIKL